MFAEARHADGVRAVGMLTWGEFRDENPGIGAEGERLLYQFGPGLGFISTVHKDGGPRLPPVCPLIDRYGLYVFILGRSPKRYDLERDQSYALHSFPPAENDDEFYCTGRARPINIASVRDRLEKAAKHTVRSDEVLFELLLERAMFATWENSRQSDARAIHSKWVTPGGGV